ncbi:polyphosphate polymerase domain-containing protein [Parablautia muri]|uniref:polyphosphate polymerase domain-containing protein n=1 Tax=Parablautia muri TaxID=2320879 RepID=UPI0024124EAD|nr:polyphosphate polymerase domain-containing protein [Parablautia muri]
MDEIHYRHEYKYPLMHGQILIENAKISAVAQKDAHVGEAGFYNIRSLYFDDYDNSCYMDNENGVDNREKYRIRIYNHSAERITLELKQKIRGKTSKRTCPITLAQCRKLMDGMIPDDIKPQQQVLHKLAYLMAVRLMKPAVIVDYDRVPYLYRREDANVRVTFDSNITSVNDVSSFLDERIYGRGVLTAGQALMEVKFDSFLPDEIYSLLQLDGLSASTFSKYYLCRKFGM